MRISVKLVTIESLFGSLRSIVQGNTLCRRFIFIRDALFGVTPHTREAGMLRCESKDGNISPCFETKMPGSIGLCQH